MKKNVHGDQHQDNWQNKQHDCGCNGEKIQSEKLDELLAAMGIAFDDTATKEAIRNDHARVMEILSAQMKEGRKDKSGKMKKRKQPKPRKTVTFSEVTMSELEAGGSGEDKYLNLHQAAAFLGLTVWAIRKRIQRGRLEATLMDDYSYSIKRSELVRIVKVAIHSKKL